MVWPMITQNRIKERLEYSPDTGIFTWRERVAKPGEDPAKVATWNTRYAGCIAGVQTHGYIKISIDNQKHYAHRLAWMYVYGECPALLDHINRDGLCNQISNLRKATKRTNLANSARKDNTSGFRGVIPSANGKRFIAQNGGKRPSYIGTFDTAEEAHAAYLASCAE